MSFDTPWLDAAIQQKRQHNEQERQRILAQLLAWLERHAQEYGVDRLYIFGSLIRPDHYKATSDVDLAVESMQPKHFAAMSELVTVLERDVDWVPLDQCHFADRIREQGILWNKASSQSSQQN